MSKLKWNLILNKRRIKDYKSSKKGIDSVLNYTKHNYIYMCAKEDFSGTHNFASNYADHMANARKYWKALNERKIFK